MPHALDLFDRIVCINLDERQDRWAHVQQTTASLLEGVSVERFSAIKPDLAQEPVHNGRAGCLLSHRSVIEQAYHDGLESVLVFEDDLGFDPRFEQHIKTTLASLKQTEWDLFYLGMTPKAPLLPAGDGLVRTLGGTTTHAIAYHRRIMPTLLQQLPDERGVLRFLSKHKSVDRYYWQHLAPRVNCYVSSPLLVFQRDDFSDIQHAKTASNKHQARQAFEKHLVLHVTPLNRIRIQIGKIGRKILYAITDQKRTLMRPVKAKASSEDGSIF